MVEPEADSSKWAGWTALRRTDPEARSVDSPCQPSGMSTRWKQKPNSRPRDTALLAALHSVRLTGRPKPLPTSALNPRFDLEADQSNRKSRIAAFASPICVNTLRSHRPCILARLLPSLTTVNCNLPRGNCRLEGFAKSDPRFWCIPKCTNSRKLVICTRKNGKNRA